MSAADISPELADVLAYLQRRQANAQTMASAHPELCEWARDRQRQLEVIADELEHGLHHGMVQLMRDLEQGATESVTPPGGEG